MSGDTLGWVLIASPFLLLWFIAFLIDPYEAVLIAAASVAAALLAGCFAYGVMLVVA